MEFTRNIKYVVNNREMFINSITEESVVIQATGRKLNKEKAIFCKNTKEVVIVLKTCMNASIYSLDDYEMNDELFIAINVFLCKGGTLLCHIYRERSKDAYCNIYKIGVK
ncbi:hypothetical protein ECANGB1_1387 [Enterospora canceri]|uniref:Uncharacterized protein n=1 Tax=Enterospora canceri TaxID=1081671 RepID=A0A1Y1S680_9MICR|nr:hypothetical protein ECANGB1_1387 [Enterospora canceri]